MTIIRYVLVCLLAFWHSPQLLASDRPTSAEAGEPGTTLQPAVSPSSWSDSTGASRVRRPDSESNMTAPQLPPPRLRQKAVRAATAAAESARDPRWLAQRAGVVVAVFVGLIVIQRVIVPRNRTSVPNGLIQVCDKIPLDAKQSLHLVRIGQRLLVLLESPQGMQRITEITDPLEVQRLLGTREGMPGRRDSQHVNRVLAQFRDPEKSVA